MRLFPEDVDEMKWPMVIGSSAALLLNHAYLASFPPAPLEPGEPQKALVTLVLLVLSIGLSLLAAELLKKKNKAIAQDDKPTALATRGAYVPKLQGRRRIGYIFTAAGRRVKAKEKAPGGKGSVFSSPKVDVFREDGWHALCIGTAECLHSIEQQGTVIFQGPITRESHPSGSTLNLGNEGSFRIFWGQNGVAAGQPINNDPNFTEINGGISSSWPYLCYIQWISKRMGPSPNWPLITYVVETRPQSTHLSNTPGYIPPSHILTSVNFPVSSVTNGVKGVAKITILGRTTTGPKRQIQLQNNTGLGVPTDFTILKTVDTFVLFEAATDIFTNETIAGATDDGDVFLYDVQQDDGWNLAHTVAELFFDPWPHGIEQAKTGSNQEVDMDKLEDLGTLMVTEGIKGATIAPDAQDLQGLLAGIMQDLGVMLPMNFDTGLLEFTPLRTPIGTLPNITFDLQTQVPEIRGRHGDRPVDRIVFTFTDQDNQYREMTITVDDDGQAIFAKFFRQRTVQLISTVEFASASVIANRRELEELAGGRGNFKIFCNRGCRRLIPGTNVLVDGFTEVMRIDKVISDPEDGEVQVHVMPDFYGAPLSAFVVNSGNTGSGGTPVEEDLAFELIELPELLIGINGPQTVMVARIRAHTAVIGSDIYLSLDDTTYEFEGNDGSVMTGGSLDAAMASNDEMEIDIGPEFTLLGADIATALDLSSNPSAWRKGKQLAVAVNAAGEQEIMFLQRVENISGDTYRMRDLIRARYNTKMIDFASGVVIFILEDIDGLLIQDGILLTPNTLTYAKSAPTGVGSIPLSSVSPESRTIYGDGPRPVPVSDIRLDLGSGVAGGGTARWSDFAYKLTAVPGEDDLDIIWAYSNPQSPGAGAGQQGAGISVIDPPPEGSFLVEILNLADALIRTETVTGVAAYTYTEVDRLADFSSSEPAGFKVRTTQVRGGFQASSVTQTFTKVT